MKDFIEVMQWLEDKWDSDYCPYMLSLFIFISVVFCKSIFLEAHIDFTKWLIFSTVCGLLSFIFWKYQHRVPKIPKGYIGFVVAITPEENDPRARTVRDFVLSLKNILQQLNNQNHSFYVLELSRYHSKKITTELEAKTYCEKCNSQFLVFGNSKVRKVLGKDYHAVNLKGLVSHSPISLQNSSTLANEMQTVLPLDFKVSCENDLAEFEIFSVCFGESAKFIIATAAMLSNNLELGLALLIQLNYSKKVLDKHKKNVPVIAKLLTLIPLRLAELYVLMSQNNFEQWRLTRDSSYLEIAKDYREKSHALSPNALLLGLIEAIYYFVINKDVNNAMLTYNKHLPRFPHVPVIRYGRAFLYAYSGDMKRSEIEYEAAFNLDSSFETAFEIEEFMAWILNEEPDKYQLYYCLALVNFRIKKDDFSTKVELENFLLQEEANNKFPLTKVNALRLLTDIQNEPKVTQIIVN